MKPDPLYLEAGARNVRMTTASALAGRRRRRVPSIGRHVRALICWLLFWAAVLALFHTMVLWA